MQTLLIFSVAAFAICSQAMADGESDALRAVSDATIEFSNKFFKVVANDNSGNLICSPLSVDVVLAMAAYGTGGSTAAQMRSVLHIPTDDTFGLSGYQNLIQSLNHVQGVELRLANKIYVSSQFAIKDSYKQLTATKFMSACQQVDFSNSRAAANVINSWCEQQTNNRIHNVITPDSLDADTAAVLVNAVYFKGKWAKQFNPAQTLDRPFHVDTRTIKNVPTMFIKHSFRFGNLPEVDARFIELPYEGKHVSMIIILPNQINGLKRVQDNIHQVNLTQHLSQTYPSEVELSLPKFKFETTLSLQDTLEKLGITNIFQNGADFSGMSDTQLKVSKVIQKAFIEVNEEGSEAAAVTENLSKVGTAKRTCPYDRKSCTNAQAGVAQNSTKSSNRECHPGCPEPKKFLQPEEFCPDLGRAKQVPPPPCCFIRMQDPCAPCCCPPPDKCEDECQPSPKRDPICGCDLCKKRQCMDRKCCSPSEPSCQKSVKKPTRLEKA